MAEDKKDYDADSETLLVKFNVDQVLKLIGLIVGQNSQAPGFILKMYMVWHHNTLENLVSAPTLTPKEDFQKFRKMYKDQLKIVDEYMEKLFLKMELRESVKQAGEKK